MNSNIGSLISLSRHTVGNGRFITKGTVSYMRQLFLHSNWPLV